MSTLGFSADYFFYNQELTDSSLPIHLDVEVAVYEVIRIIGGVPLFFEDHLQRMHNSLKMANIEKEMLSESDIEGKIKQLCKVNASYFGNIEIRISKLNQGDAISLIGFIPHSYPQPIDYLHGVSTALMQAERQLPNAKIKHSKTRLKSNAFLKEHGVFEALLVNSAGLITEGSRSNLFFIKDTIVFSTPLTYILPGITRAYTLKALQKQNVSIVEKLVHKNELDTIDAAFICGTSPGILPIKSIDSIEFDVHNTILKATMLEFNDFVKAYIASKT